MVFNSDKAVERLLSLEGTVVENTTEYARLLYDAREKLSSQGKRTDLQIEGKAQTWTEFCSEINKAPSTVYRFLKRYDPEKNVLISKEVMMITEANDQVRQAAEESGEEIEESDVPIEELEKEVEELEREEKDVGKSLEAYLVDDDEEDKPDPKTMVDLQEIGEEDEEADEAEKYVYWALLKVLIQQMRNTHRLLKKSRNHDTPKLYGHMIGNIMDMAERLDTWDPEKMQPCPNCKGSGEIETPNGIVKCNQCFNGYAGLARNSEY